MDLLDRFFWAQEVSFAGGGGATAHINTGGSALWRHNHGAAGTGLLKRAMSQVDPGEISNV
jgi:hypothetical protein